MKQHLYRSPALLMAPLLELKILVMQTGDNTAKANGTNYRDLLRHHNIEPQVVTELLTGDNALSDDLRNTLKTALGFTETQAQKFDILVEEIYQIPSRKTNPSPASPKAPKPPRQPRAKGRPKHPSGADELIQDIIRNAKQNQTADLSTDPLTAQFASIFDCHESDVRTLGQSQTGLISMAWKYGLDKGFEPHAMEHTIIPTLIKSGAIAPNDFPTIASLINTNTQMQSKASHRNR